MTCDIWWFPSVFRQGTNGRCWSSQISNEFKCLMRTERMLKPNNTFKWTRTENIILLYDNIIVSFRWEYNFHVQNIQQFKLLPFIVFPSCLVFLIYYYWKYLNGLSSASTSAVSQHNWFFCHPVANFCPPGYRQHWAYVRTSTVESALLRYELWLRWIPYDSPATHKIQCISWNVRPLISKSLEMVINAIRNIINIIKRARKGKEKAEAS